MKLTDAAAAYKVLAEVYTSLCKTPKVEEEMVKQVGNIHSLAINPDLRRALEASFESSLVTWWLGWHMTVMINYDGYAQRRMILDASAFRDCQPLRATLLSTPFVGSSLFGGQFQSSVEEATRSQKKLSQVRQLASVGSIGAQGTSGSRAPQQSQKRRAVPPLQLLSQFLQGMEVWLPKGAGKKIGVTTEGLAELLLSFRLSRATGGWGSPTRGLQPGAIDGSTPSLPPIPPAWGGGGGGWVDLPGHSWPGVGYTAWNCTERFLPCERQAVVFPPSLATNNLG